jgi:uncharacterized membrane protein (UPF0136 family)
MLAVPLFLLMSLHLFNNQEYPLRQRLVRYVWLYGFWVTIFTLSLGGIKILGGEVEHFRAGGILGYLLTGGHSPYYFLVSLAFLTCVSYLFRQAPTWALIVALVGSVVISATTWSLAAGHPTPYLVFVPFLPLAFVALLASRGAVSLWWVGGIAALSVLAAVLEWHWQITAAYSRVSVVGFATVVFLLALRVTKEAPKPVVILADCTLGVYCLHIFFIAFLTSYVLVPITLWQHLYEWFTVLVWSTLAVLGIKRALSYRMI